jgi:hypothetical protein
MIFLTTDESYQWRTKDQMKDSHIEQTAKVPDAPARLLSPHFDELAVATAQPVQLLPSRNKKLLRTSLLSLAYLAFIVAVAAVVWLAPPKPRDELSSEVMSGEAQSDSQASVDDSSSGAIADESIATPVIRRAQRHARKVTRLRFQNETIEIVEGGDSKPVPRKVGEIRYGRSSDRP